MMGREGLGSDEESKADRRVSGLADYVYNTVFISLVPDMGFEPASIEQVRKTIGDEIRRDFCDP